MFKATYTGPARALVDDDGMVKRNKRNQAALEKGRDDQISNKVVRAPGTIVCGVKMPTLSEVTLDPKKTSHADAIAVIQKNIKGTAHLDSCSFKLREVKKAAPKPKEDDGLDDLRARYFEATGKKAHPAAKEPSMTAAIAEAEAEAEAAKIAAE